MLFSFSFSPTVDSSLFLLAAGYRLPQYGVLQETDKNGEKTNDENKMSSAKPGVRCHRRFVCRLSPVVWPAVLVLAVGVWRPAGDSNGGCRAMECATFSFCVDSTVSVVSVDGNKKIKKRDENKTKTRLGTWEPHGATGSAGTAGMGW